MVAPWSGLTEGVYVAMTDDMTPEELDGFAAEYALGLLEGDDLLRALEMLRTDVAFSLAVTAWETRLVALTDALEPVTPSRTTKSALMNRIAPEPQRASIWQRLWIWQAAGPILLPFAMNLAARSLV